MGYFDSEDYGGEYVGRTEIVGDDIVLAADPMTVAQAARARAAGGKLLAQRVPNELRRQPLPIPLTPVNAGATSNAIGVIAQRIMRIDGLRNPSRFNGVFRITNISIGQEQQFVAQGSLPSELFSEVAIGTFLQGATANEGTTVSITVQNFSAAPATTSYEGGYFGPAAM